MLDEQITTEENTANAFVASAPRTHAERVAVDMTVLLSFADLQQEGDTDLVVELIDLYLQDASVKIEAIREAAIGLDGASVKRTAHSLKGSSGTLGVRQVASVCEELERLADNGLTPDAMATVLQLQEEFVRAQEALAWEPRLQPTAR